MPLSGMGNEDPDVGVVIVARNEGQNIGNLLNDISEQGFSRIVVVDDHSTDDTASLVERNGVTCIRLNAGSGKKAAIRAGVQALDTTFVLQLDADVRLGADYRDRLAKEDIAALDLLILPIRYPSTGSPIEELQRHEQTALLAFNLGMPEPFQAYGANLLYRRSAFLELEANRKDAGISSGDDHFLLNAMAEDRRRIKRVFDKRLIAEVEPVPTLAGFFQQRLRWAGKLIHGSSLPQLLMALVFGSILLLPHLFLLLNFREALSLPIPMLITLIWFLSQVLPVRRMNALLERDTPVFSVLLASILFPVYAAVILLVSIFVRPMWKGRRV